MTTKSTLKIAVGWVVGISVVLGLSYCSEWPKYRFERVAAETGKHIPGSRLITSFKSGDLASPISWFWPATTTWNFASPDPLVRDRFYTFTLVYEETDPIIFLTDVDCDTQTETLYDLDEPDTAFPARDAWGEPIVAPNGKTYRKFRDEKLLPEWKHAFCETDWTTERKAIAAAHRTSLVQ